MRRPTLATLLTVSLVTLSACAGTEQQSATEPPQETPSPEATDTAEPASSAGGSALLGTFVTAVTANLLDTPTGDWQMVIEEGGVTFVQPDGNEFSPGDIESVSESEIVFAPDPECPTQEGDATEGRYQWSIEGAELVFNEVDDSCEDRAHLLTQAPWQVAP